MARKLFGTDGVRGRANEGNMTPEIAFRLGAALTYQAKQRVRHAPRIVIGKDTRVSGYMIETALAAGIFAMGGRGMQISMSVGTLIVGLYVALLGGAELAPFGWFVTVLGVIGVAALALVPPPGAERKGRDRTR